MTARSLTGSALAASLLESARTRALDLKAEGTWPTLAIVDATGDPAAERYARSKLRAAERAGVRARLHRLEAEEDEAALADLLAELGADPEIHGILLEAPLPPRYGPLQPRRRVPPSKDVEGLHPENLGRLMEGDPVFVPCTAAACLELLKAYDVPLAGAEVVIVGRSPVIGRPAALLFSHADATVTLCHSRTRDLAEHTRRGEILVVAAGRAGLITREMVRPGAVVLDVGVNVTPSGEVLGDVDPRGVAEVASALTPTRGGIGPVTTALLIRATVQAACRNPGRST